LAKLHKLEVRFLAHSFATNVPNGPEMSHDVPLGTSRSTRSAQVARPRRQHAAPASLSGRTESSQAKPQPRLHPSFPAACGGRKRGVGCGNVALACELLHPRDKLAGVVSASVDVALQAAEMLPIFNISSSQLVAEVARLPTVVREMSELLRVPLLPSDD
jgi:hypothetical protein